MSRAIHSCSQTGDAPSVRKFMSRAWIATGVMIFGLPAFAVWSDPVQIERLPDTSLLWHTATGNRIKLSLDFPSGQSSASLTISDGTSSQHYEDLTDSFMWVDLPAVAKESEERIYSFTLRYENGFERTTHLAVVRGVGKEGDVVLARCIPEMSARWNKFTRSAVLPVFAGTRDFKINGASVMMTGGDGMGWSMVKYDSETSLYHIEDILADSSYVADLYGQGGGLAIMIR